MAIKRRTNKKRAELTANAIAFLEGRSSFTQFKDDAYLADLWEKYGDTSVATWEEGDSRPTKQRVYAVRLFSPSCLTTRRASSSCFLPHGLSASTLLRFSLRQLFSWPDLLTYELPSQSTDAILLSSSPYGFLLCKAGLYHGIFSLQCEFSARNPCLPATNQKFRVERKLLSPPTASKSSPKPDLACRSS